MSINDGCKQHVFSLNGTPSAMTNESTYTDQVAQKKTKLKVTLSEDERMRIMANLMIDRILEDYRKGQLKFVTKSDKLIMEHKDRNRK